VSPQGPELGVAALASEHRAQHGVFRGFDALGDVHLAFTRQERYAANLLQIEPQRIARGFPIPTGARFRGLSFGHAAASRDGA